MTDNAEKDAPVCEHVCEYAMDVGLPEYSGLRDKPQGCGNCAHYVIPPAAGHEEPWEWHPDGPEAHAFLEKIQDEETQ
jgi:hypothetical protein